MSKIFSILIALVVLVVSGVAHGLWAERWSTSEALQQAVGRVAQATYTFGEWKSEDVGGDKDDFDMAGAQGWWMRNYQHPRYKGPVLVILMCGRSGQVALHTPEVCYRGAGYEMLEDSIPYEIKKEGGAGLGQWRTARFAKPVGPHKDLRLIWAWTATGRWQAPTSPRWEFGGEPFLYKLYVAHEFPDRNERLSDDVGVEFLRQFLPELEKALFPASSRSE